MGYRNTSLFDGSPQSAFFADHRTVQVLVGGHNGLPPSATACGMVADNESRVAARSSNVFFTVKLLS